MASRRFCYHRGENISKLDLCDPWVVRLIAHLSDSGAHQHKIVLRLMCFRLGSADRAGRCQLVIVVSTS